MVYSYLERTKDYLTSFTVAQKTLLLGDRALQATSDAVKYSRLGNKEKVKTVLETVDALRCHARAARRAGEGAWTCQQWLFQDSLKVNFRGTGG